MANKSTYRLHKPSNTAVVTLGGKTYRLGPWQSEESKAEYRRLVAEFEASGGRLLEPGPEGLSVNEVLLAYVRERVRGPWQAAHPHARAVRVGGS